MSQNQKCLKSALKPNQHLKTKGMSPFNELKSLRISFKEYKGWDIHMHTADSRCYTTETNTTL